MKKVCVFWLASVLTLSWATPPQKKVCINQFVEHPALDRTTQGIVDGLAAYGYKQGVNLQLRKESAQANSVLAAQIATKFVYQAPDVVIAVATVPAQILVKYAKSKKIKLIFASVTDPLAAGLVKTLDQPGNNTSGVSNFVPLAPQLSLFKEIQPSLKRLGFVYNPSEMNSIRLIKELKTLCPPLGITLVLQAANKTVDVPQAATKLAKTVDAFFISNDNTALSALPAIITIATKVKVPVYVSDTDAVSQGAVAALGPNQYNVGLQAAKMVARSLQGEDVGTIPVEFPRKTELYINADAAKKVGLSFSKAVTARATKIIKAKAS